VYGQKRISFAAPDLKMETTRTIKWRRSTPEPGETHYKRVFNAIVQSELDCSKAPW